MNKTFKEAILDVCDQRNDELAHQVYIRVQGAVSDLHAADAQYHKDCHDSFMGQRNIQSAKNKQDVQSNACVDPAFDMLLA